jgi:hypothetical protein
LSFIADLRGRSLQGVDIGGAKHQQCSAARTSIRCGADGQRDNEISGLPAATIYGAMQHA